MSCGVFKSEELKRTMDIIGDISEHEMVAIFLQTEIRSPRYDTKILALLE